MSYLTQCTPTPYPTEVPPTLKPTGAQCAIKDGACKKHTHCYMKRCNKIKDIYRK